MSTFVERQLEFTITLGTGTFGEQLGDTVKLSGFRSEADMASPCGDSMGVLHARIYGLKQSVMNQLTVIGPVNQVKSKNSITLSAGDSASGMADVFKGTIYSAWADYASAPDVVFNIISYTGMDIAVKPADAVSYPGAADAGEIMQKMAALAGLAFVNDGVSVQLSSPSFSGTLWQQIKDCAEAARCKFKIELGTLTVWPADGAVSAAVPLVSSENGMIGYPSLSSQGMTVKSLFRHDVVLGGSMDVKSSLDVASGSFVVFDYSHSLSCQFPGGPWFTEINCYPKI